MQIISLSVKTLLRIRDDISHVSDSVNQMEWLRKQIEVIETMLRPAKKPPRSPKPMIAEEGDEDDAEPAPAPPRVLSEVQEKQKNAAARSRRRSRQEAASGRIAPGLAGAAQQR